MLNGIRVPLPLSYRYIKSPSCDTVFLESSDVIVEMQVVSLNGIPHLLIVSMVLKAVCDLSVKSVECSRSSLLCMYRNELHAYFHRYMLNVVNTKKVKNKK